MSELTEAAARYIYAEQRLRVFKGDPNQQDKVPRASDERSRAVSRLWHAIQNEEERERERAN